MPCRGGQRVQGAFLASRPLESIRLTNMTGKKSDYGQASQGGKRTRRAGKAERENLVRDCPRRVGDHDVAARQHLAHVGSELGGGAWQHGGRYSEQRRLLSCCVAVAVALGLGQGRHEALIRHEEGVHQGRVDPGEEGRIVGAVAGVRGEGAGGPGQPPVHPVVDPIDGGDGGGRLLVRAERQGEHGREGALEPSHSTPALCRETTVIGHQGMGELKQDGPPPACEQDDFPMELLGHPEAGVTSGRRPLGVGRARLIKEIPHGRSIIPLPLVSGRAPAISHRRRYGVSWSGT